VSVPVPVPVVCRCLTPPHFCLLVGSMGTTSSAFVSSRLCAVCVLCRYGTTAQTNSTCTGACTAGYYCPAGSVNPTPNSCPQGQYSLAGAGACTECPPGVYGGNVRLTTPLCSGPCIAGEGGREGRGLEGKRVWREFVEVSIEFCILADISMARCL
jgi:hypothetical protein